MFFNISEIPYKQKRAGVYIKSVTGEQAHMTFLRLEPGVVTDHSHLHEQMGYIFSGLVALTIDGETQQLGPGDAYYVPGNVQHGFKVLGEEDLEYVEIFSPPKEENKP